MTPDTLKDELRAKFREGATVAGLIAHARESLGDDSPRAFWIDAVISAFRMHAGGWNIVEATESFGTGERRDEELTWIYLEEILVKRPKWDEPEGDETRWYDRLEACSWNELGRKADAEPGISEAGWAALGDDDRRAIRSARFSTLRTCQTAFALAALAEQLQRRITELERQPAAALAD